MPVSRKLAPAARFVLERLAAAGFEAYAVGGCVRDALLDREPHDWDVATSAPVRRTEALFDRTAPTGERFGTVTVLTPWGNVEVTTFRRDGKYRDSRRPETVDFTGSLREDLARRDFTVNAMAMDADGHITDLFGGRKDLAHRVIRCVGDPERRFAEDALRMLRAVRFEAQLGFEIEAGTLSALTELAPLAERLSAERVWAELSRTLASPRPELAGSMIEYGLLSRFISKNGYLVPWERLAAVPEALREPVFALLCRSFGLVPSAGELLRSLRAPARLVREAAGAEALFETLTPSPAALRASLCLNPESRVLIAAGAAGFYGEARAQADLRQYVTMPELAVSGGDLCAAGLEGPRISEALRRLALSVTKGELRNTREALLGALSEICGEETRSQKAIL